MSTTKAQILYYSAEQASPLGSLRLLATARGLCWFAYGEDDPTFHSNWTKRHPAGNIESASAHPVLTQVKAYLNGRLKHISAEIDWLWTTPFQAEVYRAVLAVPYGETRTYGEIAAQIGRPRTARAVGAANGANPLPIIIPCHRLVGADGSLRGYGGIGGIKTKQWLLDLEKANKAG